MNFLRKILDILFPASETETRLISLCNQGNVPHALPVQHTNIFAVANYRDPTIRSSIRILKTKRNVPVAQCFAKLLHENISALLQDKEPFTKYEKIILVPAPVTKDRLRERGFNQTELIASELVRLDERYAVKKILHKVSETKKQSLSISKTKRMENIKGCFACKKNKAKEQGEERSSRERPGPKSTLYVVLDDVVTTGATMNEALLTLSRAKYKPAIGIAVAH